MKITKTTENMAKKRGIKLYYDGEFVEFCKIDEDGEPWDEYHARYQIKSEGLFFEGGCFETEEWPYWIKSDSDLRGMLNAMEVEMM